MKALIFGSFNPVTNAHVNMGIAARNVLGPDFDVTYIPASDNYIKGWKGYKEGSVLPADVRVRLLEKAVAPYGFLVSTVEVDGTTDGKTYNTINYFGFDDCVLCLGMDNIVQMKKWFAWQDLLPKTRLLIFRRGVYGQEQLAEMEKIVNLARQYKIVDLDTRYAYTSSTEVRNCYRKRELERAKTFVPENVFKYLEENEHVYF